jgi:predicted adenine nucleotide alpha hydrolase (AANH) superfamily ATPase
MKCLLHMCCAPCGSNVIEELQKMNFSVSAFFYNPNIFPHEEYELRLKETVRLCESKNIKLIKAENSYNDWLEKIKGNETEPEGGKRCEICFALRLSETAQVASENGFDAIATTLTISPHKNAKLINEIGHEMSLMYGVSFVDKVWRKEEGYKKSCEIAKENNFHRQNYCGCQFSQH